MDGADFRQQQELQEYAMWLADPIAQQEYQQYLTQLEQEKEPEHEYQRLKL